MQHVMIDLETMGKGSNAPVVGIGAVFFNPETGAMGKEFQRYITLESAVNWGGVMDASTIIWWLKQSEAARKPIIGASFDLCEVLGDLNTFIERNTEAQDPRDTRLWGNGIAGDCVWIRNAYERAGMDFICGWWSDCDVRTLVELGRAVGFNPKATIPFEGEPHKPLDDAKHQVRYVSAIWQHMVGVNQ